MRSSSAPTTKKVSNPRIKRRYLKIGLLSLLSLALAITLYSFKERITDGQSSVVVVPTTISIQPTTIPDIVSTTITPTPIQSDAIFDLQSLMRSVVSISAYSSSSHRCDSDGHGGSGTIVLDGSYVLTNYHVVAGLDYSAESEFCELEIYITDSPKTPPRFFSKAEVIREASDSAHDLALIKLTSKGLSDRAVQPSTRELNVGDEINILGYPEMGLGTITYTSGDISGWSEDIFTRENTGNFYQVSAKMGPGVSGGAAFSNLNEFIGIPTGGTIFEESDNLGFVRPSSYAVRLLEKISK